MLAQRSFSVGGNDDFVLETLLVGGNFLNTKGMKENKVFFQSKKSMDYRPWTI